MSEKRKKTFKYLNYGEHLLVLTSRIIVQSLQKLKCISEFSGKRRKSMIK